MARCSFVLLLVAALSPAVPREATAQTRCERLADEVIARNRRGEAPEALGRAAHAARRCFGTRQHPLAASMFQAEGWALVNTRKWRAVLALADTFSAHGYGFAQAPHAFVQVHRHAGVASVMTGRASEGIAQQQRLLPLARRVSTRQHAEVYADLARSHHALGDLDAARRAWRQHVVLAQHLPGPERTALVLRGTLQHASLWLRTSEEGRFVPKDTLEAALRTTRWADSIAHATHDRLLYGETTREQVRALVLLGRDQEALHTLGRGAREAPPSSRTDLLALQTRLAVRRGDGPLSVSLARAGVRARGADDLVDGLALLGEALEHAQRWHEAEDTYREALALAWSREQEGGPDEATLLRRGDEQRTARGLARTLVAQGDVRGAFALHDAYRGRLLALYRMRAQAARTPAVEAALEALERTRDSLHSGDEVRERARLDARRYALQSRLARMLPLPAVRPTDVDALQRRLRQDGRVLVSYVLDPQPHRSMAFVVTGDTVRAVPLALHAAEADRLVASVNPVLLRPSPAPVAARGFDLAVLHALHERLVRPLGLPPRLRLTVLPDGPLFALPFSALVTQPTGRYDLGRARFLVEDRAVSVELSAGLLIEDAPRPASDSVVILARADYAGAGLSSLPFVDAEQDALRRLTRAYVFRDEQAMESAFARHGPRARVLHLAAHTDVSARSPLDYAFRFAPGDGSDGRLHLYELFRTPLLADLVVLSGCNTARGDAYGGEGMIGLQYAFRAAGARSVLATHWVADDASTGRLMVSFYEGLRQGLSRDDALQQAQRRYLGEQSGADRSPYYWAAPVLYGHPGPVHLPRPVRFGGIVWALVALGGAVALAYGSIRRRHARYPCPFRRDQGARHRAA